MHKKYGDFRCLSIYFEPDDEAAKHECRNPTCCLLEILMKILHHTQSQLITVQQVMISPCYFDCYHCHVGYCSSAAAAATAVSAFQVSSLLPHSHSMN